MHCTHTHTHSKLAQLAAACNSDSNIGSLSNQRVRSSLNYRRRRTVARTDIHVRDYEYVAPAIADYLTSLMWVLGFICLQMAPDSISELANSKIFLGEHALRPPSGASFACSLRSPNCSLALPPWFKFGVPLYCLKTNSSHVHSRQ